MDESELKVSEIDEQIENVDLQILKLKRERERLLDLKNKVVTIAKKKEQAEKKEQVLLQEFPWASEIEKKLHDVFKLPGFRQNQREIINCMLAQHDCFVLMPTGGGKSLCYQLAAIMKPGFSVVVTPLISLMHDQIFELKKLGISAAMIFGGTEKDEFTRLTTEMQKPPKSNNMKERSKLIYVSPELIVNNKKLLSILEKCYKIGSLDYFIVDEAHCCSEWGHDFRPDYKKLSICKVLFPKTPIVALTATAAPKVQADVEDILHMNNSVTFSSSINRANLFYCVRPKESTTQKINQQILDFIEDIKGGLLKNENPIGIIYCLSKKETEEISSFLNDNGLKAAPYHSTLESKFRDELILLWRNEKIHIVVATIAFGLGINKANVRFVLHHTFSKSLESYYQESGRAGRDGNFATCCILYRPSDLAKLSSMCYFQHHALDNLFSMIKYASSTNCRKEELLLYFGENTKTQNQDICCDNCSRDSNSHLKVKKQNLYSCVTSLHSVLSFLDKTDQRVTFLQLITLWRGLARKAYGVPKTTKILPKELLVDPFNCEEIIISLLSQRYLSLEFHNTSYTTVCYIKGSPHFLRLSEKDLESKFNYNITLSEHKKGKKDTPKKRPRSKSLSKEGERKPKLQKSSSIVAIDCVDEEQEEEADNPLCIELD